MKFPRLDETTRRLYESVLPRDPRINTRSMFGGLGSFVNGNMFAGALGDRIFLRLPGRELEAFLNERGGEPFEPVKGHAMAGYATVPRTWMKEPDRVRDSMGRALEWVATMPPKRKSEKRSKKR